MALIKCPECGAEVSERAFTCLKCGYPINPQLFQIIRVAPPSPPPLPPETPKPPVGLKTKVCAEIISWAIILSLGIIIWRVAFPSENSLTPAKSAAISSTKVTSTAPAAVKVDARELFNDYSVNATAADSKYKGQILKVSGRVLEISKDPLLNNAVVRLEASSLETPSVRCSFSSAAIPELSELKRGDWVFLEGKGTTMILGSPTLADCSLTAP